MGATSPPRVSLTVKGEPIVKVVGAGLAGCEAAWQLVRHHPQLEVHLHEMKPDQRTPAQHSDGLAELVCSNSLRSNNPDNAVGLIKAEMRRLDSLIIAAAEQARVPAGDALAVDRQRFSAAVEQRLEDEPRITLKRGVVGEVPTGSAAAGYGGLSIIASGPLTADSLADDILACTGKEHLYFYDAIAPIVAGDSIDRNFAYEASRYNKGPASDYLNCPLNQEQYEAFLAALLAAECMPAHDFEEERYFEGCLPVEVMAARGPETLRFGCMKPVGLDDPRTGRWPHAVVQLRKEDLAGQAYNLVGFQTKMKHSHQRRVLRMIPALAKAEFLRLGVMHRNTYLDSPALLNEHMALRSSPLVHFAGQITGVEGYVESAAHGLMTALMLARRLADRPVMPLPPDTALGALWNHVRGLNRLPGRAHEPQNVNWGMFPPLEQRLAKKDKKRHRRERAERSLLEWAEANDMPLKSRI